MLQMEQSLSENSRELEVVEKELQELEVNQHVQSCKLTLYLCQWSCVVQCVDLNLCLLSCPSSSVGECYVLVSPP